MGFNIGHLLKKLGRKNDELEVSILTWPKKYIFFYKSLDYKPLATPGSVTYLYTYI